ncbi:hypothetical protein [Hydrogenophaga sp.]|uniref:hypothetical protein n=1 Tax=Hydrogenophaga sp. TaxID=1904254 RepID=UPI0027303640|nr:hypothetical protein [Hydrogenophaga sp.]MDP1684621.1 hypothetical protein [Hydrogenophaga sp.]
MRNFLSRRYNPRAPFDYLFQITPSLEFEESTAVAAAAQLFRSRLQRAVARLSIIRDAKQSWLMRHLYNWIGLPVAFVDIAATDAAKWAVTQGASQEELVRWASEIRPVPVSEALRKTRECELYATAGSGQCTPREAYMACLELRVHFDPLFDITTPEKLSEVMSNNIWGKTFLNCFVSLVFTSIVVAIMFGLRIFAATTVAELFESIDAQVIAGLASFHAARLITAGTPGFLAKRIGVVYAMLTVGHEPGT